MQLQWFDGLADVGLSAGASAPESVVAQTVERIAGLFPGLQVREIGQRERRTFRLPAALVALRGLALSPPAARQAEVSAAVQPVAPGD